MIGTASYYLCLLWGILFLAALITGLVYLFMSYDLNGECPDPCAPCQIGPCFDIFISRAQAFFLAAIAFAAAVPMTYQTGKMIQGKAE